MGRASRARSDVIVHLTVGRTATHTHTPRPTRPRRRSCATGAACSLPNYCLAHLVKDATRGLLRALQMRLSKYGVAFGHWVFPAHPVGSRTG